MVLKFMTVFQAYGIIQIIIFYSYNKVIIRCVNAGHGQKKIVEAVQKQVAKLDYAPSFNMSHKLPFEFARYNTDYLEQYESQLL